LRVRDAEPPERGTTFAFTPAVKRCEAVKKVEQGLTASPDRTEFEFMRSVLTPCSTNQVKEHPKMRNRRHTLLWMKDLIEHMSRCHDQLEFASDGDTQSFLADAMIGDLHECQKLCEQLRTVQTRPANSPALA
jgi:hypothetical protein